MSTGENTDVTVVVAPKDAFAFSDAREGDALLSTPYVQLQGGSNVADTPEAARLLLGTRKWNARASIVVGADRRVAVQAPLRTQAGLDVLGGGDLTVGDGGVFTVLSRDGSTRTLVVHPEKGASLTRPLDAAAGVRCGGNALVTGSIRAGLPPGTARQNEPFVTPTFHVRPGQVDFVGDVRFAGGSEYELRGGATTVSGVFRVLSPLPDGTRQTVAVFDDARVLLDRPLRVVRGETRVNDARVDGELYVTPYGTPVLEAKRSGVRVLRHTELGADALIRGALDVIVNDATGGVGTGTGTATSALAVREGQIGANRDALARCNVSVAGAEYVRGPFRVAGDYSTDVEVAGFDPRLGAGDSDAFVVDGTSTLQHVALNRRVNVGSNLHAARDVDVGGSLRVRRATGLAFGVLEDENLIVAEAATTAVTGDLAVRGGHRVTVEGSLDVRPGDLRVLAADGSNVSVRRPLDVVGDTRLVVGAFAVDTVADVPAAELGEGDVGPRAPRRLIAADSNAVAFFRDVNAECNLDVAQALTAGAGTFAVTESNVQIDGDVAVAGAVSTGDGIQVAGDASLRGDVDIARDLRVFSGVNGDGSNFAQGAELPVLDVTSNRVRAERDVSAAAALDVYGNTRLHGDYMRVTPSGATDAFTVSDSNVVATRDARAACNLVVAYDATTGRTLSAESNVRAGLVGSGPRHAFRADAARLEMDGDAAVASNVTVGSNLAVGADASVAGATQLLGRTELPAKNDLVMLGGDLRVAGKRDDAAASWDDVFRVTNDVSEQDSAAVFGSNVPGGVAGSVAVRRALAAESNADVGGAATVRGDADFRGARVTATPEFPDGQHRVVLRSSSNGVAVERVDLTATCNLAVGRNAAVEGALYAGDDALLAGALRVRPQGSNADDAFAVTHAEVAAYRAVALACNLDVAGDASVQGAMDVAGADGLTVTGGPLVVDPGSGPALTVDDAAAKVERPAHFTNRVSVSNVLDVASGLVSRADATVRGDLWVRPAAAHSDDTSVYAPETTVLAVTADGVDASRDTAVRCNLDVGGRLRAEARTELAGDVEVRYGQLHVYPDANAPASAALAVRQPQVEVARSLVVRSNLNVASNASLGADLTVGKNALVRDDLTVEDALYVLGAGELGSLLVTSSTDLAGPLAVKPGGQAAPTALSLDTARLRVDRSAEFGCNVAAESNLSVRLSASVGSNLTVGSNLRVERDARVDGGLTVPSAPTTLRELEVSEGGAVVRGDARFEGNLDVLDVAQGTRAASLRADAVEVARPFEAACNVQLRRDVEVGKSATVGDDLSVGRDVDVGRDLRVGRELLVDGSFTVTGSIRMTAPFVVETSNEDPFQDPDRAKVFEATDQGVFARRDLTVGGDAALTGDLEIGGGTITNATLEVAGDLTTGGNSVVEGATELRGPAFAQDALDVSGTASFAADVDVASNLVVKFPSKATPEFEVYDGGARVPGALLLAENDARVEGTLTATTLAQLAAAEIVDLDVSGPLTASGEASFTGDRFDVQQSALFRTFVVTVDAYQWAAHNVCAVSVGGKEISSSTTNTEDDAATLHVDLVAHGRDCKTYAFAVKSGLTGGAWRRCLPLSNTVQTGTHQVELEARTEGAITELRVINVAGVAQADYDGTSTYDVTLAVRVHRAASSASVDAQPLSENGTVTSVAPETYPSALLTQWVPDVGSNAHGRVGVNVAEPAETLEVGGKTRARDQILAYDGSAGAPSLAWAADGDTGVFSAGADALGVSTAGAERARFDAAGRLGVGTAAPSERLHVSAGKVRADDQVLAAAGSAAAPAFAFSGDSNTGAFRPAADTWAWATAGAERGVIDAAGRFGFGVSAAQLAERVEVGGKARFRGQALTADGDASVPGIAFASDSNTGAFRPAADAWAWTTAGAERARLDAQGRLGVGVTAPTERVDVDAKARVRDQVLARPDDGTNVAGDSNAPAYSFAGDSNTGFYRPEPDAVATVADGREWARLVANGFLGLNVEAPQERLHVAGGKARADDQFLASSGTADAPGFAFSADSNTGAFLAAPDELSLSTAATERVRVAAQGHVGIGVATPGERLDVAGAVRAASSFYADDFDSCNAPGFSFNGDRDTGLFHPESNTLAVACGGAEMARVLDNGFVGIGTPYATELLHVSGGKARVEGGQVLLDYRSAVSPAYSFAESSNAGMYLAACNVMAWSTAGVERARLNDIGFLGVAVSGPTERLDVDGRVRASQQFLGVVTDGVAGTSNAPQFSWSTDRATGMFHPPEASNMLALATNGTEWLRMIENGFVGVNISAPQERLHVDGKVRAEDQFLARNDAPENAPAYSFAGDSNTGIFSPAADELAFSTDGLEWVRIAPNGYVGINVKDPKERLDIDGAIRASSIQGSGDGGNASTPTFTWPNDQDTGFYNPDANNVGVVTGGTERMRIDEQGNVGIGVTDPGEKLVVDGNVHVTGGGQFLGDAQDSAAAPSFAWDASRNTGLFWPESNAMAVSTNGVERARFGPGGNLGVGVTAPTQSVDVAGSVRVRAPGQLLGDTDDGPGAPSFAWEGDRDTGMFRPTTDADVIAFSTAGVERARLSAPGFLGVNVAAPVQRLDVAGNARLRSGQVFVDSAPTLGAATPAYSFTDDANTGVFHPDQPDTLAFGTTGQERVRIDAAGNVGFGTITPLERVHSAAKMRADEQALSAAGSAAVPGYAFVGDSNTGMFSPSADVVALTTAGAERMRVDSQGRVGIGVTSPAYALDVDGEVFFTGQMIGMSNDTATVPSYTWEGFRSTGFFLAADDEIGFTTGGGERVRIDGVGYVGLGVTDPGERLDVSGSVRATAQFLGAPSDGSSNPSFSWDTDRGTGMFRAGADALALATSNTERVRVQPDGKVGIGVDAPGEQLDVDGAVRAASPFFGPDGTAGAPAFTWDLDRDTGLYRPTTDHVGVSTAGAERVRVDAAGRVGIGVQAPTERLDVDGQVRARDQVLGIDGTAAAPSASFYGDDDTGTFLPAADAWAVTTGGSERVRVTSAGRVGVNVTAPGERLDVSGKVRTDAQFLGKNDANDGPGAPSFSFTGDSNTGMFTPAGDRLAFATAGTERLRIEFDGKVGINTSAPGAELEVDGDILASGDVVAESDARLKTQLAPLREATQKLRCLRGYTFVKTPRRRTGSVSAARREARHVGLLAQDVLEAVPEAVRTDPITGVHSVAYGNLVALLVEAVKESDARLAAQERQLEEFRAKDRARDALFAQVSELAKRFHP